MSWNPIKIVQNVLGVPRVTHKGDIESPSGVPEFLSSDMESLKSVIESSSGIPESRNPLSVCQNPMMSWR